MTQSPHRTAQCNDPPIKNWKHQGNQLLATETVTKWDCVWILKIRQDEIKCKHTHHMIRAWYVQTHALSQGTPHRGGYNHSGKKRVGCSSNWTNTVLWRKGDVILKSMKVGLLGWVYVHLYGPVSQFGTRKVFLEIVGLEFRVGHPCIFVSHLWNKLYPSSSKYLVSRHLDPNTHPEARLLTRYLGGFWKTDLGYKFYQILENLLHPN